MKCPRCGEENLAFTEGTKGNFPIWFIVLSVFIMFMLFSYAIYFISTNVSLAVFFIFAAFIYAIVFRAVRYSRKRKTYTKAVCKNCGKTFWIE